MVWVENFLSVREANVPFCEAYADHTPWTCGLEWDLIATLTWGRVGAQRSINFEAALSDVGRLCCMVVQEMWLSVGRVLD